MDRTNTWNNVLLFRWTMIGEMETKEYAGLKRHWRLLLRSLKGFGKADPLVLASSIAFFNIFALPGLLVILVEVSATLFSDEHVKDALVEQAGGLLGEGLAGFLIEVFQEAGVEGSDIWDKIFGIASVVISATMAFIALQRGLKKNWGVEMEKGKGLTRQLVTRGIALLLLAGFSFLLPISLMFDNVIVFAFRQLSNEMPSELMLKIIGRATSLSMLVVVMAVLYKVLPNAKVHWGDVWAGAVLAGVLFAAGRYVIGLYIKFIDIGQAFGGAGQIVLLVLLWMFMSAMIILFGAYHCHTVALANDHGISPGRHAKNVHGRSGNGSGQA